MSENPHNKSPKRRMAWIVAGAIILSAGVGGLAYAACDAWLNWRQVLAYRPIMGTVLEYQSRSIVLDSNNRLVNTPAWVTVAYKIEGTQRRTTISLPWSDTAYETGKPVRIYYDPHRPTRAVLHPRVHPRSLAAALVLLPLAVGGLWFMWAGLKGVSTYGLLPPILLAYFLLSCLCAAALLSTIDRLTWKQTWILGGGMAFPIVPLASVLGGTLLSSMVKSRRSRRQRSMSYETTPPMPWGFAAALLWLTALVLAGVISAVWTFSEQAKAFVRSRDRYACVEGTILSAGVGQTPRGTSGESFFYWPDIKYHYVVDGTDYWSSRFSDTGSYFTTRPPAYKLAMQHAPPGLRVKVYFDPKDPSKAVLDRSLPKANLMLLLALQPPALSCIVLLGSVLYMPIHRRNMRKYLRGDLNPTCRVPTWGLWRIEEEGLLAMEPIGRRLPGTLIAYCFTCLIMLLVGAIAGRSDWFSPKALVYSTIACVCAGMLGWILAGGSRPNRLEIDPRHHTIRLMGKHQDMELAFSELARFTIEPQGIWATLKLVTTGGSEITLHEFRPAWPLTPSLAIARKIATAFASTTGGEVDVRGAEKTKRSPTVA